MSRLEYCAEAEPLLLALRDRISSGKVSQPAARAELVRLVGRVRYNVDWDAAQKPCPKFRGKEIWSAECFEAAHPSTDPKHRLYSLKANDESVVADLGVELGLLVRVKNDRNVEVMQTADTGEVWQ